MPQAKDFDPQDVVNRYFECIHQLRNGDDSAVDRLVELWTEDGVFEFAGAPPVTGAYKGRNAIRVLYKNRVRACGMPLALQVKTAGTSAAGRQVALGLVETKIQRSRTLSAKGARPAGQQVAVGWKTVVGTDDRRGFEVSGSHTFVFKGEKINSLKVAIAPKPQKAEGFSLEGLAVNDIGRLALAAWAVV